VNNIIMLSNLKSLRSLVPPSKNNS